jgi:hypothetical protein
MKRYLAPILGIGVALMILVPTTFAVGEPGSSVYANLPANRFPGGATVASARLRFIDANTISLEVFVQGNDVRNWTVRVYSQGTCTNVTNWVANRKQDGTPFNKVLTNQGTVSQLLYFQDVNRVRTAIANGQSLAFMLAGEGSGSAQTNSPYRTCTAFGPTPPNFTTTTSTTSTTTSPTTATTTTQATVTTTTTTTANSTGTVTATTTPSTTQTVATTLTTGACPTPTTLAVRPQAIVMQTLTQTATQTVPITVTTTTVTAPTVTNTATTTAQTCSTATATTGTTTTGTTTTGTTTETSPTTATSTTASTQTTMTQTVTTVTADGTTTTFTFP